MQSRQVLVIAGPTGSGESTITDELLRRYSGKIQRLITATTRSPRHGEEDGVNYYFFDKKTFFAKQQSGEILESTYVSNRDTYYGSCKDDLEKKLVGGKIVIVNSDIVGAKFYKTHYNATTIFILPTHMEELSGRLQRRNPEMSNEELRKRTEDAEREIHDDQSFYDYTVTNADGKLEASIDEVVSILVREGYDIGVVT